MALRRADEPSLADVLRALAEAGPHHEIAQQLGITTDRLHDILNEGADSVAFLVPKRRTPPEKAPSTPVPEEPAAAGRFARVKIYSDGAARGNPGPAGAGAVVRSADGQIVARLGKFLGVQTNNVAEYEGLLIGLEKAIELGAKEVQVFADSLIISQLKGEWKIKHPGLKPYYQRAKDLLARFDRASLQHIRRELNGDADEMSNRAIDERM